MTLLVNAYSTCVEPVELDFPHRFLAHRDHQTPELADHLNGFIGFILDSGNREMTASLYAVMRHLQRVQHQVSFEVEDEDTDAMADWGWQSNSIFFLPDSTVRDPAGAVLVNPDTGEPDEQSEIPFPADARARKLRSLAELESLGVETPELLPPVVGESELIMRPADEVAWRAIALFIVAVRAESLASKRPIPVEQFREKSPMAFEAMTPIESLFMENDDPDQQMVVNMAWRYEALFVLQWALVFHEELKLPTEICDVPLVAQTMVGRDDRQIVNMARLRSASQILDALDLNQRLLWATRQARLNDRPLPADMDGGVISERQHALNWLIQFENADWDDVDTPS